MSLMTTLSRFARSPHARRMLSSGVRYAQSPQGRAKIARVREQLAARRQKPRPR